MSGEADNSERRHSSTTCIFEDLERKTQTQVEGKIVDSSENSTPRHNLAKTSNNSENESSDTTLYDSSAVSTVSVGEMCKICHCGGEASFTLIAPCYCSGSLKYVHQECLQRWIKSSDIKRCELCKYPFAMQAKVRPLYICSAHSCRVSRKSPIFLPFPHVQPDWTA